jgi:short-subunit dehydrogenase
MADLKNKIVWITGASSGIGEALAMECGKAGAKLVLSARREEELDRVSEEVSLNYPVEIMCLPMDLSRVDEINSKAKRVMDRFGRVDVLFCNGGISQRSLVAETDFEVDRKIMEIDYFANVALVKALLPSMLKNGSGHFGVTSSLAGKFGVPYRSGYCGAKHALHGFFETVRAELFTKGIRVTIFCPGFVRTKISVNAVSSDGSKNSTMDEAQKGGISPEQCASEMVRGIVREKNEVYIGKKELIMIYLKRWFPDIHTRLIRKVKVR